MNYKVLYRKYRPNNFDNIVGQDYIITTLKNSIIHNNVSHAYIFSGPRGTGKTSTAKVFSKAINCLQTNNGSPCDNCEFCRSFQENPDIIEIDAASNNGVDEIRNLIDNIKLTPSNGKYKIYIIDEVHMLTTSAFNALLLTLEEPPSHAIFILATTNIENVPITILSRCQRFDFQKITVENIVNKLTEICHKENIDAEENALTEIASISEGGLRDALSILDQMSKNNQLITLDLVEKQIKTVSKKSIIDLLDSIEDNNVDKFINTIKEFEKRAVDYKTLVKKIIDISSNRAKNIKKNNNYQRLTFLDYKNIILNLSEALTRINVNVNPYVLIEVLLLEYFSKDNIKPKSVDSKEAVQERENVLEVKTKEKSKTNNEFVNVRINNTFVNAKKVYLEEIKSKINDSSISLITNGKIKSILMDSNIVAASDKNIILSTLTEHAAADANELIIDLEKEINVLLNKNYFLVFVSEEKWNHEKNKYIDNIKNNKKYEYIEEKDPTEDINVVINDVFDISKVEIV